MPGRPNGPIRRSGLSLSEMPDRRHRCDAGGSRPESPPIRGANAVPLLSAALRRPPCIRPARQVPESFARALATAGRTGERPRQRGRADCGFRHAATGSTAAPRSRSPRARRRHVPRLAGCRRRPPGIGGRHSRRSASRVRPGSMPCPGIAPILPAVFLPTPYGRRSRPLGARRLRAAHPRWRPGASKQRRSVDDLADRAGRTADQALRHATAPAGLGNATRHEH
jgi:hypothetical protein